MAKSIFAMRLVNLRSVTCYTDQHLESKCSLRNSKSLYLEKKGCKEVVRRLSILRTGC